MQSARRKADARDGTMEARDLGTVDEDLTASMFSKLAAAATQKFVRPSALTSAVISPSIKSFTTVRKLREVGGTAANSPLPGKPEKIWFTAKLGRTPPSHRLERARLRR
jgi:hypothetical protein